MKRIKNVLELKVFSNIGTSYCCTLMPKYSEKTLSIIGDYRSELYKIDQYGVLLMYVEISINGFFRNVRRGYQNVG